MCYRVGLVFQYQSMGIGKGALELFISRTKIMMNSKTEQFP